MSSRDWDTSRRMKRLFGFVLSVLSVAAVIVAVFVVFSVPARAHTEAELESWLAEYERMKSYVEVEPEPRLAFPVVAGLAAVLQDMKDRHPCSKVMDTWTEECDRPTVTAHREPSSGGGGNTGMGSGVEQWRDLVAAHFPVSEVERALCIMSHESGGNPNAQNPRSTASGLFQFLDGTWAATPYAGSSKYDGEANIAAAAWLVNADGWHHWSPWNRGLCR